MREKNANGTGNIALILSRKKHKIHEAGDNSIKMFRPD